jgi:hypothetical protein
MSGHLISVQSDIIWWDLLVILRSYANEPTDQAITLIGPKGVCTRTSSGIPFSLNTFNEDKDLVGRTFSVHQILILGEKDVAYILQAWTGLDPHQLMGSTINSPENGIFTVSGLEISLMRNYKIATYKSHTLSSTRFPYKYTMQMDKRTADVDFLEDAEVASPKPRFLKIHHCCLCKGPRPQSGCCVTRTCCTDRCKRGTLFCKAPEIQDASFRTLSSTQLALLQTRLSHSY